MILIGSKAIKHWFPDFPRVPKDSDYLVLDKSRWNNIPGKEEYYENDIIYFKNKDSKYIDPNLLYTLKISHAIGWDINWEKHVWDIQWLKEKGCKLNEKLFYKLYNHWEQVHGKNKRSDLEMTVEEFFDNAIICEYKHDWLHTLLNPIPTYTKILKDGAEVEVDENKFNTLSYEEKCDLVNEEVMVMAWERYPKLNYRVAFTRMLKKFILNHAPIWEALFIIQNHKELHKPNFNYFKTIENGLKTRFKNP